MHGIDHEIFFSQRNNFSEAFSLLSEVVIQQLWMSSILRLAPMAGSRMLTFTYSWYFNHWIMCLLANKAVIYHLLLLTYINILRSKSGNTFKRKERSCCGSMMQNYGQVNSCL